MEESSVHEEVETGGTLARPAATFEVVSCENPERLVRVDTS